jgi:hypothetical protein
LGLLTVSTHSSEPPSLIPNILTLLRAIFLSLIGGGAMAPC